MNDSATSSLSEKNTSSVLFKIYNKSGLILPQACTQSRNPQNNEKSFLKLLPSDPIQLYIEREIWTFFYLTVFPIWAPENSRWISLHNVSSYNDRKIAFKFFLTKYSTFSMLPLSISQDREGI